MKASQLQEFSYLSMNFTCENKFSVNLNLSMNIFVDSKSVG